MQRIRAGASSRVVSHVKKLHHTNGERYVMSTEFRHTARTEMPHRQRLEQRSSASERHDAFGNQRKDLRQGYYHSKPCSYGSGWLISAADSRRLVAIVRQHCFVFGAYYAARLLACWWQPITQRACRCARQRGSGNNMQFKREDRLSSRLYPIMKPHQELGPINQCQHQGIRICELPRP